MAAVDAPESLVVARFNPVFQGEERSAYLHPRAVRTREKAPPIFQNLSVLEVREEIEYFFIDTIRAGAYDKSRHRRMRESFEIERPEALQRGIGVGKRLEISEIVSCARISEAMELYPLVKLLSYRFVRGAVARMEGGVVAEGTAPAPLCPVSVRAGEARVDHKFLETLPIGALKIAGRTVISPFHQLSPY